MRDQHTATVEYDRTKKTWAVWYRGYGMYIAASGRDEAQAKVPAAVARKRRELAQWKWKAHAERVAILSRQPGHRWEGVGPDMYRMCRGHLRARGLHVVQRADGFHYLEELPR